MGLSFWMKDERFRTVKERYDAICDIQGRLSHEIAQHINRKWDLWDWFR